MSRIKNISQNFWQVLAAAGVLGLLACSGGGSEATSIIGAALDSPGDLAAPPPGGNAAAGPNQGEGTLGANYDPNPKAFNKKKTSNFTQEDPSEEMLNIGGSLAPVNSPTQDYLNSLPDEDEDGSSGGMIHIPGKK